MQMDNRLYKLMDWPSIEEIVYSESSHPKRILGGHRVKEGFLIQVFRPDAVQISVSVSERKKNVQMEKVDDAGFFAALIPLKKSVKYVLNIEDKQGHIIRCTDPYSMEDYEDTDTLFNKFIEGTEDKAYRLFGGHECEKDGVSGTLFRTWAPYALRVSVVGDFNNWDGRIYQMERITENGIYELFIPGLCAGTEYMYEMKFHGRETAIKADPYAMEATRYADAHSVVTKSDVTDKSPNTGAAKKKTFAKSVNKGAVSVLEVKLKDIADIIGTDAAYGTIADKLIEYVKAAGYTHIQIMSDDGVFSHKGYSYAAASYYVPLTKYGSAEDFKQLVNSLHKAGIGVILEWNGAYFGSDMRGIVNFDGGSCYGYLKPRLDKKPYREVTTFAYDKGEVRSFLISNLSMWLDEYDIDGIRLTDTATMLYLDYGRKPGEWIPNIYGGKENINAVEFIQNVRKMVDSLQKNTILAAEESSGWQFVTGDIADGGLGFDYKWNDGWKKELVPFIEMDPLFRKGIYGRLTYSMLYQYSDDFIIGFSRNGYGWKKGILKDIVPDNGEDVLNHVKTALGYMYFHPGKKLINIKECSGVEKFVAQMNNLYRNTKALYEYDDNPSGFEWADDISAEETVIAVLRRDESGQSVIGAVNFTPVERKEFCIGVDEAGKYTDVLNGSVVYESSEYNWNSKDESVFVDLKPLGISLYTYEPYTEIEKERIKIEKETKEALMLAKKEADEAKAVKDAAIERAKQAKEAEIIALAAAKEAEKAEKEAAKKAEEARIACIKIDENAKKKLAELKKMEEKQGE